MKQFRTTGALLSLTITFAVLGVFSNPAQADAAVADWIRGASMVPMSTTDLSSDNAKQSMRDLDATGATYVSFVVPYYQSNQWSTDVGRGWNTPTDESLAAAIDYAKSIGLNVSVKMHIEPYDGAWRAHINPSDRDAWFAAYGDAVVHTAEIADAHGAGLFVIGSELVSMAASSMNSTNTAHWQTLIERVRGVYSGDLTYGANSNNTSDDPFNNEKKFIGFWGSLDYAGIDPYYSLNSDDSVEGMKGAWDHWNKTDLQAFSQSVGKQILISEVGYRSLDNSRQAPWDWGRSGSTDLQEQANAYEALMGYWNDYPYIAGVIFWEWSTNPNAGGNDSTYTPQNKPAEAVMTAWFTDPNAPQPPSTTTPTTTPQNPGTTTPQNPATTTPNPGSGMFETTVVVDETMVAAGEAVSIRAVVQSADAAQNIIVDIEVYDSASAKIHQHFYEGEDFATGETRSFETGWTPEQVGTYVVKVGLFNAGWSTLRHWDDNAVTITVVSDTSTPTSTDPGGEPTEPDPTEPNPDPDTEEPSPEQPDNRAARIDRPDRSVRPGEHLDFVGREFGREEDVTVTLNGEVVRTAHADGGGNFSTGSIAAPDVSGTYTYEFTGVDSGAQVSATVTVTQ